MKRIKTDALKTRHCILDAAEKLFHRRGLSRPTLEEIANEAGVTRGAVYWHFKNKCEVFEAMCQRVELPAETVFSGHCGASKAPLDALGSLVEEVLTHTLSASHERTIFEILTYKCELVEENRPVVERRLRAQRESVACIRDFLDNAVLLGDLPANTDTAFAATMMYSFIQGVLDSSVLENRLPAGEPALQREASRIAALAMELPARCIRPAESKSAAKPAPLSTPRKTHQDIPE